MGPVTTSTNPHSSPPVNNGGFVLRNTVIVVLVAAAATVGGLFVLPQMGRTVITVGATAQLELLLLRHPLPDDLRIRHVPAGQERQAQLTTLLIDWKLPTVMPVDREVRPVMATTLVPWVSLLDPRTAIYLFELTSFPATIDVALSPLAEVGLPYRALPVQGLYPGQPGYPLVTRLAVAFDPEVSSLAEWVRGLPVPTTHPPVGWIGAVGDIMPGRGVDLALLDPAAGPEWVFGDLLPFLQAPDLMLGNLEAVATRRGRPADKTFTFRFNPDALGPLARAGFDYVSVANNHSFDYGEIGFGDTLAALSAVGLATSGGGVDRTAARVPYRTTLPDGSRVLVLGIGAHPVESSGFDGRLEQTARDDRAGILWADGDTLELIRTSIRPREAAVIVVHGGAEWTDTPAQEVRALYRSFIDAGARVVVGSHPHFLQGYEAYSGGLILYSLGNFVFPGMQETGFGEETAIARIGIWGGEVRYVEFIPARIEGRQVRRGGDRTLERLRQLSLLMEG